MNEARDIRLKRLRLRSWRRGIKEMDLILGGFADTCLKDLLDTDLDAHEALMSEMDQDLYAWINGAQPAPAHHRPALDKILTYLSSVSF
ncbi:MAG: succinate dehydrogenase assembly factor 2 [Pseudomonadota bacterium]